MAATTSVGTGCPSSPRRSWPRLPAAGDGGGGVERAIARIARFECPVLITGETGVGKDEVARAIHAAGPRRDRQFVTVNCGGLVSALAESQLFGHEKGAFTGATSPTLGAFRTADGGTLFLDEIGEMPLDLQPRLLRVLQHHVVVPVGASREHPVDIHVLAATNRNLAAEIRRGAFREDLFHRLNAFHLAIPPLRHRTAEIPPLVAHFSAHFAAKYQLPLWRPSADLLARFLRHSWPGNIRQLTQTIQRIYVFHDGIDDVLREVFDAEPVRADEPRAAAAPSLPQEAGPGTGPLDFNLAELRRRTVRRALAHTGGHRTITARLLGVSPNTLTKLVAEACPAIPSRSKPVKRPPPSGAAADLGPLDAAPAGEVSPGGDRQLAIQSSVVVYQIARTVPPRLSFADPQWRGDGLQAE